MAARTRWKRVGFYDVNRTCVEPRLGAIKIVQMARQSGTVAHDTKIDPTRLRRNLRMWRQSVVLDQASASRKLNKPETVQSNQRKTVQTWRSERDRNAFKSTDQYKRAQARLLLRATERSACVRKDNVMGIDAQHAAARAVLRTMPAHAMSKQLGRDIVTCRQRNRRIVASFSAAVQKECIGAQSGVYANVSTAPQPGERSGTGFVPFALTTGRDDVSIDKSGIHILGAERELGSTHRPADLDLDQVDAVVRPRVPAARIPAPSTNDERFPMTMRVAKEQMLRSVLEPKFDVVEPSTRGHRFVRFEKQLDRSLLTIAGDYEVERVMLPSEFPVLDKLKFPATHAFVDYAKMQGRGETARHEHPAPLDVVYEPKHETQLARALAPVDMSKMLARPDVVPTTRVESASLRDQLMCKLRANHDELEKAMRLLSRHTRLDTGAIDMKRGTPRFPVEEAHADQESDRELQSQTSRFDLSVLSTRQRTDRTLVNMKSTLGRLPLGAAGASDNTSAERPLVLSDRDDILSKRKRAIALVDMHHQIAREDVGRTRVASVAAFLDPTRDSATTRFFLQAVEP